MMVVSLRKTATPKMAMAVLIGIRRRALDEKEQQQREKASRKFYTIKFHITSQISPKHPALFTSAPGFSLCLSLFCRRLE
jgi:hypothetical protein|tara:strand:+ start:1866 stop:2105 length:240 start_codon:yes stop_codon:yes gene_type:complete